ncbi:MAG: two-component regulator propeller domain-containing protein [Bacteroidota bacterium]
MLKYLMCLLFVGTSFMGWSQFSRLEQFGTPSITNYSPRDYLANPVIFDIFQGANGLLYFANQRGLIEYDGVTWRLIDTPKNSQIRTIAPFNENDFLVGTESGLGLIQFDEFGNGQYIDTSAILPKNNEPILNIFKKDSIFYVRTFSQFFLLSKKLKVLAAHAANLDSTGSAKIQGASSTKQTVYFQDTRTGLYRVANERFFKIKNSDIFKDKHLRAVIDFKGEQLFVTQQSGFYRQEENGRFEQVKQLKNYTIKEVNKVNEDYFAIGTFSRGVVLVDTAFQVVFEIKNDNGLIDNGIRSIFKDQFNQLWVGTNNGISKIDIESPVLSYGEDFEGFVIESLHTYRDHLVLSSHGGAYIVDSTFQVSRIEGIDTDCFGLDEITFDDKSYLFISELNRLSYLDDDFSPVPVAEGGPYSVRQSPLDSNQLIVLHYNGIQLLQYTNGQFIKKRYIKDFSDGEPYNFIVQPNGDIWIGTKPDDGIYKINVAALNDGNPSFEHYHTSDGLPKGQVYMFQHENKIYAGTDEGLFKFDGEKFSYSDDFNMFGDKEPKVVHRINQDHDGNIWAVLIDDQTNLSDIGFSALKDGEYVWNSNYFADYKEYIIHSMFHDSNGTSWFGGYGKGLLSFNANKKTGLNDSVNVYVQKMAYGDSTLFHGTVAPPEKIEIAFQDQNLIRFQFGTNFFKNEGETQFAYYIEGFENEWSDWTKRHTKEYNLNEGQYTLHLKARNVYDQTSRTVEFSFTILPPWYRTTVAYIIYFALLVLIIYGIALLSIKRVKNQNIRLEKLVAQRTEEVTAQKKEAENQRDISENQKVLLEEKNKEIVDSINYSKRIQSAILPSPRILNNLFLENFVFYVPKDIVAGDFYWLQTDGNQDIAATEKKGQPADIQNIYLAAADCTGHGVPGAMVSVVCNNALNMVLREYRIKKPAEILNQTRDMVIAEFGKQDNDIKDGMDIALCKFNFNTKQKIADTKEPLPLEFAGANNPLWIIRDLTQVDRDLDTSSEYRTFSFDEYPSLRLYEIKGDNQPIGKFATREPFTNHKLNVHHSDSIYMFSDGYRDQFGYAPGAKKAKKFKPSRFRKLLFSNHHLPMEDQKMAIKNAFFDWKGDHEQVDDVCVIGVRL